MKYFVLILLISRLYRVAFAQRYRPLEWVIRNPKDGTFRKGNQTGPIYRSVGASLYPYWVGPFADYSYRLMSRGKANGLDSFRIVLIFEQLNGDKSVDNLWSETIWRPIDKVLANANILQCYATLELSGLANWMNSNNVDPYDPAQYYRTFKRYIYLYTTVIETRAIVWDQLVDFVTSRTNVFNGVPYTQDPTIFAYSVLGEVIPSPRSFQTKILRLLQRVSGRLKQRDGRHLVGSGGLLHMSPYSGYNDPVSYWKNLYSCQDIDFGMIHVYQSPKDSLQSSSSEWTNLRMYANFCRSIGKPLVLDEFGLQMSLFDKNTVWRYFDYAFQTAYNAGIPIIQMWNWAPGSTFDIFESDDLLVVELIRKWSNILSEDRQTFGSILAVSDSGSFINKFSIPLSLSDIYLEKYLDLRASKTVFDFDKTQPGTVVGSSAVQIISNERSTSGRMVAMMPFKFSDGKFESLSVNFGDLPLSDWSGFGTADGKLICDVYVDSSVVVRGGDPAGLMIRFAFASARGKNYFQSTKSGWSNFLVTRKWNQVVMRLDPDLVGQEFGGSSNRTWLSDIEQIQSFSLILVHQANLLAVPYGRLWIDTCRLQISDFEEMFIEDSRLCPPPVKSAALQHSADPYQDEPYPIVDISKLPLDNSGIYQTKFAVGIICYIFGLILFLLSILMRRRRIMSQNKA